MSEPLTYESSLRITADHPSLPGHFPGAPLVPGVVLLDQVLLAAEKWLNQPLRVSVLTQTKFNSPLLPEQTAVVKLQLRDTELRFSITRAEMLIAQGVLKLAAAPRAMPG